MQKVKVGILGCGAIAPAYLRNLKTHFSGIVEVVACADSVPEAAVKCAREFNLPRAYSPAELLADPAVEIVVNLTPAPAHHVVSTSILKAGKHLFSEKPLALSLEHGREILTLAADRGLHVAGAADTFLGGGVQFCRKLLDSGRIGTPVAASILVGVNIFHFARYHSVFRGALLDLGPYYLTALVALLGPITRVSGAAEIRFREKPHALDSPEAGTTFPVDLPTSVSGSLDFADGTVASLVASCDMNGNFRRVEIYGTKGTLRINDTNRYSDRVVVRAGDVKETFYPHEGFCERGRGLGVAEMALALRENRAPRANGRLMYHVLEAMLGVQTSSATNRHVQIETRVERPAAFDYATLPKDTPAGP
jgi:predicted dehydrogenase